MPAGGAETERLLELLRDLRPAKHLRGAGRNPRCAGGRTKPHKGHSVNQARENSVNHSYRPICREHGEARRPTWPLMIVANAASELIGGLSDNGKEHGKNFSVLR